MPRPRISEVLCGGASCESKKNTSKPIAFEVSSKRRKSFPSETHVKRDDRVVAAATVVSSKANLRQDIAANEVRQGEGGCLFDETGSLVEPTERRYMDVSAGPQRRQGEAYTPNATTGCGGWTDSGAGVRSDTAKRSGRARVPVTRVCYARLPRRRRASAGTARTARPDGEYY